MGYFRDVKKYWGVSTFFIDVWGVSHYGPLTNNGREGKPMQQLTRFFLVRFGDNEPMEYVTAEGVATDIAHGQFDRRPISQILEISPDVPPEDVTEAMAYRAWGIVANTYEGEDTYIDQFIRDHVPDLDERIVELDQSHEDERILVREISSIEDRV